MKKRKFKSIRRKSFTVSQDNFEDWVKVLRRNLDEMEILMKESKKILGAVTEFMMQNLSLLGTDFKERTGGKSFRHGNFKRRGK